MTRFIGIRHRIKRTAEGEARPTQVVILQGDAKPRAFDLDTENDELDFLLGRLPTGWRALNEGESVPDTVLPRHVKETEKSKKVPKGYHGLRTGDVVGLIAGGSGGILTFALSRRAEEIKAEVLTISPGVFKDLRAESSDKDDDALLLARTVRDEYTRFKPVTLRDRQMITLIETWRDREQVMKERIAAEQRLRQRMIGYIFCSEEGRYPEAALEDAFDQERSNNVIVKALLKEEVGLKKAVEEAVEQMPVYKEFLSKVEGCGPLIAARLIAGVGDIRKYDDINRFKAYCGVHVRDGEFPKRKAKSRANWNALARQGFYLFVADQCLKRKDSEWGKKLRGYKAKFRAAHPVEVKDGKRTLYTDGHIHRMAIWRTATRFAEKLFREWRKIEGLAGPAQTPKKVRPAPTADTSVSATF